MNCNMISKANLKQKIYTYTHGAEKQREADLDVIRELLEEEECDCPPEWPRCGLHRALMRLRTQPLVTKPNG